MSQPFKGIPISSKSAMNVPVEVVSQPTQIDIDALYNRPQDYTLRTEEQRKTPLAVNSSAGLKSISGVNLQEGNGEKNGEKEGQKEGEEHGGADEGGSGKEGEGEVLESKTSLKASAVRSGKIKVSDLLPVDFDDFMHSSIVAIPKRMPTMLDVRAKDPNFRLRWVNFKADGGRLVDERKAMGFSIAKPEEVVSRDGGSLDGSIMVHPDGIKYHDVICMKVPTRLLFGWLKQNALESMRSVSSAKLHREAANEANKVFRQGLSGENMGTHTVDELKDSIQFYVPGS